MAGTSTQDRLVLDIRVDELVYALRLSPDSTDVVLRPLADVPATRWIVALSRPDRARRAVVARVIEELRAAAPSAADAG